jgi:hypothetical protein
MHLVIRNKNTKNKFKINWVKIHKYWETNTNRRRKPEIEVLRAARILNDKGNI